MTTAAPRWAETWRAAVDDALAAALADRLESAPARLAEAIRYAALSGGKRLRPLLTLATAAALGGSERAAMPAALALELVHAYSLVHDDLPVMDDDALRRGRPTVHVQFDEATAVLAGDALQTLAFEILTVGPRAGQETDAARAARTVRQVGALARAAGAIGMVGGQALDLEAEGSAADVEAVEGIHARKTGALIGAALRLGAESADAAPETARELESIGRLAGLAFQIQDDVLDATGTTGGLGKTAGKDAAAGKATWPAAGGIEAARARSGALVSEALARLESLGLAGGPLEALVRRTVERAR